MVDLIWLNKPTTVCSVIKLQGIYFLNDTTALDNFQQKINTTMIIESLMYQWPITLLWLTTLCNFFIIMTYETVSNISATVQFHSHVYVFLTKTIAVSLYLVDKAIYYYPHQLIICKVFFLKTLLLKSL